MEHDLYPLEGLTRTRRNLLNVATLRRCSQKVAIG